jgi:serine/threonine protein kinase
MIREAVVGRGRKTIVYRAWDPQRACRVALKVARRSDLRVACGAADFEREFEIARQLAHPHAVRPIAHGVAGDEAFLAMEWVAGATAPGEQTTDAVLRIARESASALAVLHRQGWVHRDVKRTHLLRRADGSVALADFGIACRAGHVADGPAGRVIGTPLYAAPEQSAGAPAQPGADVYSLGVVLYELLCGRAPFPGETPTELLGQHLIAPVPPLAARHAAWQPLLEAMLAKDPAQRPADGDTVLQELGRLHAALLPTGAGRAAESRST